MGTQAHRSTTTARDVPGSTPSWLRRGDLAVCVGGPRDGFWYFTADLDTAERAAITVASRCGHQLPSHGYRPTGQARPHPQHPDAVGHIYAWQRVTGENTAPWRSRWCTDLGDHAECATRMARDGGAFPATWPGATPADALRCGCSCQPATAGSSATGGIDVRPADRLAGEPPAPPLRERNHTP